MSFSQALKELRAAAGITQDALANRANLSLRAIIHFEGGSREPSWKALCALADALEVPLDAFRKPGRKPRG